MDYHQKQYWEKQYRNGSFGETYEWLVKSDDIPKLSHAILKWYYSWTQDKEKNAGTQTSATNTSTTIKKVEILHGGCGNSTLGVEIFKLAQRWKKSQINLTVTNLDYSPVVVNQMMEAYADIVIGGNNLENENEQNKPQINIKSQQKQENQNQITWVAEDIQKLSRSEKAQLKNSKLKYDLVIDKGLADALYCEPDAKKLKMSIIGMLNETLQCMKSGGLLLIFSLEGERLKKDLEEVVGFEKVSTDDVLRGAKKLESIFRDVLQQQMQSEDLDNINKEKPLFNCDVLVYRKKTNKTGTECQKCKKKGVYSNIKQGANVRCGRCGCVN